MYRLYKQIEPFCLYRCVSKLTPGYGTGIGQHRYWLIIHIYAGLLANAVFQ